MTDPRRFTVRTDQTHPTVPGWVRVHELPGLYVRDDDPDSVRAGIISESARRGTPIPAEVEVAIEYANAADTQEDTR